MDEDEIVVLEDDEGNKVEMLIMDTFLYKGQEYAVLIDAEDGEPEEEAEEGREVSVYITQIVPDKDEEGEDIDVFLPVPEELEEEVYAFAGEYLNGDFDDDELDEEPEDGEDEE